MIDWNCNDVEAFLEIAPQVGEVSNPLGVFPTYTFDLPCPLGTVRFVVWPTMELCMFNDESEFVSGSVQTRRIFVSNEPEEEGGQCVILQGRGGHACITLAKPYYRLFFSMYGDKPSFPFDDLPPSR
jgi:hypothetical protein